LAKAVGAILRLFALWCAMLPQSAQVLHSRQKPRFLPASDEVMSAEIAAAISAYITSTMAA
jgi:hypothetical protein